MLPGVQDVPDNIIHGQSVFDLSKNHRPLASHQFGIALHYRQVRPDRRRQVGFVDYEQVRLCDARPAFAWDFVPAGHINHIDSIIGQFAAEMGGEIIPARFNQQQLRVEPAMELFQGEQIGRDILTDGRMRTAASLDGADAFRGQRLVPDEEFGILFGRILRWSPLRG